MFYSAEDKHVMFLTLNFVMAITNDIYFMCVSILKTLNTRNI
jgi:hypothetical protein